MRPFRPRRAATPARPTATPAPCWVEPLEPRRLLAASPSNPFPDDGGPDQSTATYLGRLNEDRPSLRTVAGAVRPNEVQDVYRIKIDRPTDLRVDLHVLGRSADTKVYLMRHGETRAVYEASVIPTTFVDVDGRGTIDRGLRLTVGVDPGSYYVAVYNGEGTGRRRDKGYVIETSGVASPPPSPIPLVLSLRAIDAAAPFPSVSDGPQQVAGLVAAGRLSVYRLDVLDPGPLTVDLENLTGDADLALYDAAGRMLGSSGLDGRSAERLVRSVGPYGDDVPPVAVYLGVATRSRRNVGFTLRAAQQVNPGAPVGRTISADEMRSARPIAVEDGTTEFAGLVEGLVPAVYRLDLPRSGSVRVDLTNLTGDADLHSFDATGRLQFESTHNLTEDEQVGTGGDAGSYFVRVSGRRSAKIDFRLHIAATLRPLPAPGSTVFEGRVEEGDYRGKAESSDATWADFYTFVAPTTGRVTIEAASSEFDTRLVVVHRASATEYAEDAFAYGGLGTSDARVEFDMVVGRRYLVQVRSERDGVGDYTLTVSPEAGEVRPVPLDEFRANWPPTDPLYGLI